MTAKSARKAEPEQQQQRRTERGLFDYSSAPILYRKQLSDLEKLLLDRWLGRLPDTQAAHLDAAIMLDQLAVYIDGHERIDRFFENSTLFDKIVRDQLKQEALARAPNARSPAQLGKVTGLLWATQKRLRLTNITAVDKPPAEVLKAEKHARDTAARKRRQAQSALPKPPSTAQLQAAERLNRRLLAIHDAVGDGAYVSDICKVLSRLRHTPFCGVKGRLKGRSLSETVRRAIKVDPELQWEIRSIDGRPDLIPQMWVTRRPNQPKGEPKMTTTSQPPPLPTNRDEYRVYLAEYLARLDGNTVNDLGRWYHSEAQRHLRESCGIDPKWNLSGPLPTRDDEEFIEMAIARRRQLLGK